MAYIYLFLLSVVLLQCNNTNKEVREERTVISEDTTTANEEREPLPEFTFYRVKDDQPFTNNDLEKNKQSMIIFFSPFCPHCQHEAEMLDENMDKFKDVQIIMVSPFTKAEVEDFIWEYGLHDEEQVIVLLDKNDEFAPLFGARAYPAIYLYDEDKNLIKSYEGTVEPEELADQLK